MTTRTEELVGSFDDAVAKAVAELEEATESETETDLPSATDETTEEVDQGEVDSQEQADEPTESATQPEADEEVEEIFGETEESEDEIVPVDLESMAFELPGVEEPVSLQELQDGYLRQADYTRKTQDLAAARVENEQATRLWDALQATPVEVVRKLATDAGLIAEGAEPMATIELSPLRSTDQVEAEVAKRVAEEVAKHPSVIEAQQVQVRQAMETAFGSIEKKYEVELGPRSRKRILVEAQKAGTPDLELVFNALMSQREKRAADADDLRAAAPSRSTGRSTEKAITEGDAMSIEEAFEFAQVSLDA